MADNPFAFPLAIPGDTVVEPSDGMTLRDWFAGQFALTAAAHGFEGWDHVCPTTVERTARMAYQLADAMLAERPKAHP